MIGIYGVVNYSVSPRTREIGIRLALGARPPASIALVARTSLLPVAVGQALVSPVRSPPRDRFGRYSTR